MIDAMVRGLAVGALLLTGLAIWRSSVGRHVQIAALLMAVSTSSWLICEAHGLWAAFGDAPVLALLSLPVAAFYWLFVLTVFEERRITPLMLAPAALFALSGPVSGLLPPSAAESVWAARNLLSAALAVHAAVVILRGWRGDLVEARRRLRAILMLLTSAYAVLEVVVSIAHRLDPAHPWLVLAVGSPAGGAIIVSLVLAIATLFLQPRASLFGPPRRVEAAVDARADAADRVLVERLQGVMAAGGWRREGLTIGDLAEELATPEHRLRRLINQRLGHRNFADFVNGHRIEAAKRRLADPAEARTTVAAIAFDLGYGSLGPFNRAFRAATGVTPTEWRRTELGKASPILSEAV
jgi:AraC-like DNA-binding protein